MRILLRTATLAAALGAAIALTTGTAGALSLPPAVPGTVINTGPVTLGPVFVFPTVTPLKTVPLTPVTHAKTVTPAKTTTVKKVSKTKKVSKRRH